MNKKHDNILIIYAKRPELGKCKTRIAGETSPEFALEFSLKCLNDLVTNINNSNYYDTVVAVDSLEELGWFQKNYGLEGLVVRKYNAKNSSSRQNDKFNYIFSELLSKKSFGYKKAVLIPMDLPFLSAEELISAFARLDKHPLVYGPELNGGVYLIGIKAPYKENIFTNIPWSTEESFESLMGHCDRGKVFKLRYKRDLNSFYDILESKNEIAHRCPSLYSLLEKNGYYLPDNNRYINFDDLPICVPVVSAIVEKGSGDNTKILIQTRYKPSIDPANSNLLEIPSGLIGKYESAKKAVLREVKEETGANVRVIDHNNSNTTESSNNDLVITYNPFLCNQQLRGGRSYLSLVFICKYVGGKLEANLQETRDPRWISLTELANIIDKKPDSIFSLNLPVLINYLKLKNVRKIEKAKQK